jgi:hypothetical protein
MITARLEELAREFASAWIEHLYTPSHGEHSTAVRYDLARDALTRYFHPGYRSQRPDLRVSNRTEDRIRQEFVRLLDSHYTTRAERSEPEYEWER